MSDARVSIKVRCTYDSPMGTCINSADERIVCTESWYNFEIEFCSLCLSRILSHSLSLSVCVVLCFTLPQTLTFTDPSRLQKPTTSDYSLLALFVIDPLEIFNCTRRFLTRQAKRNPILFKHRLLLRWREREKEFMYGRNKWIKGRSSWFNMNI